MTADSRLEEVWATAQQQLGATRRIDVGRIEQLQLDRFAVAVSGSLGDRAHGHAAPLFLSSVLVWHAGPPEGELLADGNASDPFSGFDVAGLRMMAGGQELTFHRDIEAGSEVRLDLSLSSVELKEGSSGQLLVLVVQRSYFDEAGLVSECRETFLGREA